MGMLIFPARPLFLPGALSLAGALSFAPALPIVTRSPSLTKIDLICPGIGEMMVPLAVALIGVV